MQFGVAAYVIVRATEAEARRASQVAAASGSAGATGVSRPGDKGSRAYGDTDVPF